MSIEIAVPSQANFGNCPTWDHASNSLLWVDVLAGQVHRYTPDTDIDAVWTATQHVGAAQPRSRGGLVLNLRDGIAIVDKDGTSRWLVYWHRDGMRGSDAAVDSAGRLWAGTTQDDGNTDDGWLAKVEPNGDAQVMRAAVSPSGGMSWSPEHNLMYSANSASGQIDIYDYELCSGVIFNQRPLCLIEKAAGRPHGLCVDADGGIWVTLWGGNALRRYAPTGNLDREIQLPVAQPSGCCFGGADFTDLYITTARAGLSEQTLTEQPLSGSVLVIPQAGHGLPAHAFAG